MSESQNMENISLSCAQRISKPKRKTSRENDSPIVEFVDYNVTKKQLMNASISSGQTPVYNNPGDSVNSNSAFFCSRLLGYVILGMFLAYVFISIGVIFKFQAVGNLVKDRGLAFL